MLSRLYQLFLYICKRHVPLLSDCESGLPCRPQQASKHVVFYMPADLYGRFEMMYPLYKAILAGVFPAMAVKLVKP